MSFAIAALAMVLLFFVLSGAIASARGRLVDRLRGGAPAVKRWSARVLLVVGGWLIALGIWAEEFAGILTP